MGLIILLTAVGGVITYYNWKNNTELGQLKKRK